MSDFKKKLFAVFLIFSLSLHFSVIFLDSSTFIAKSESMKFATRYYVHPFFQQSWALFAPIPKKHMALYVRYQLNNQWSDWENVLQKKINQHQINVLLGNETKVQLFSNSLTYFFNSQSKKAYLYTKEYTDVNFQIIKHEVRSEITNYGKTKGLTNFEIIATCNEGNLSKSYYFKNLSIL